MTNKNVFVLFCHFCQCGHLLLLQCSLLISLLLFNLFSFIFYCETMARGQHCHLVEQLISVKKKDCAKCKKKNENLCT